MARKRASMREGPLAELFRATEAAQRQAEKEGKTAPGEPLEETVEHPPPSPHLEVAPEPEPEAVAEADPAPEAEVPTPLPPPTPRTPDSLHRPEHPTDRGIARLLEPLPEPPPRLPRAPRSDSAHMAVIRGVGGGRPGLNPPKRTIGAGICGAALWAVNTDPQPLARSE